MLSRARALLRLRPGHGLLVTFAVTILVPGLLLAFIGFRGLVQERRLADQQIRETLDRAAELAARDLERDLRDWQQAVDEIGEASPEDNPRWPDRARLAFREPASGVVVFPESADRRVFPAGQLLYDATRSAGSPPPAAPPAGLAAAEAAELREKNYPRAILLYERLLDTTEPSHVPLLRHRLARTYRKAGRLDEAVRAYEELKQSAPARIGALPADLVATFELCSLWAEQGAPDDLATGALELYRGLVHGRWSLEKSRYFFYSDSARTWLAHDSDNSPDPRGPARPASPPSPASEAEVRRLQALEEQKLVLTRATEDLLGSPRRMLSTETGAHLAFWRTEPFVALVLSERLLRETLWPRTFAATTDQQLEVAVRAANGRLLFGSVPAEPRPLAVTRSIQGSELPWLVQVWPREPDTLYAELAWRQNLYLAMLVLVLALLISGSYLTVRTVRRELEIARLKSEFVSTVSHEFRSPLAGIRHLGEMLMRGRVKSDERTQDYYRMIVRESDRLGRLVENVLDFSRMEEGRKQYRFEPLEPSPWLRKLAEDFQSEVTDKGVSIVSRVADAMPMLTADREALTSAVHNLLDNAVKYSPESKTVWLDAEATDGTVSIRVRDRGLGIPEEDQHRVFEKFYRGGGEVSRKVKGAGLGLSLVKHIVTAHGGSVEFQSRVGEGSTFSVHLQAATPVANGGSRP